MWNTSVSTQLYSTVFSITHYTLKPSARCNSSTKYLVLSYWSILPCLFIPLLCFLSLTLIIHPVDIKVACTSLNNVKLCSTHRYNNTEWNKIQTQYKIALYVTLQCNTVEVILSGFIHNKCYKQPDIKCWFSIVHMKYAHEMIMNAQNYYHCRWCTFVLSAALSQVLNSLWLGCQKSLSFSGR